LSSDIAIYFKADSRSSSAASGLITRITLSSASSLPRKLILPYHNISLSIEPNHAAGVKLIFLILTVASAGILFY